MLKNGIDPLKLLFDKFKRANFVRLAIEFGIDPLKLLLCNFKMTNCVRLAIVEFGIDQVKLLYDRSKRTNCVRLAIESGIDPLKFPLITMGHTGLEVAEPPPCQMGVASHPIWPKGVPWPPPTIFFF
jgi:hypothetical protein